MNKSILRFAFILLVSFLFAVGTKAQTASAAISKANLPTPVTVFDDPYQGIPVRIPAMTITRDGGVIAMVDYRHNFSDIGWNSGGTYRLDILMRRSDDGGRTWSPITTVVEGRKDFGYGDPSVVADRDSAGLILMQAVSGNVPYVHATAKNPQHAMFFRSTDGGKTWDKGHDVAPSIYNLYRDEQPLTQEKGFFLTSGKITQSRFIKKDKYYRLYIAHPVLHVGTFVIYSDDFGKTWQVLGGAATIPGPDGDESKVEELPDGSVLLSCRKFSSLGRRFNVFVYKNKKRAEGAWSEAKDAKALANCTRCNGDVVVVPVRRAIDGRKTWLAIQSLLQSKTRDHLGFYYREIPRRGADLAPALADNWQRGVMIHEGTAAYSTMSVFDDGTVGILYEADLDANNTGYKILFSRLSVSQITGGAYEAMPAK